jgi:predicted transcriptional regulator
MTTAAEVNTEPLRDESGILDTGPRAVLHLSEQGLPQRTIADLLHISQATVTRRLKEAIETRQAQRVRYVMLLLYSVLTMCAVIVAAAVASLAWG